MSIIPIHVIRLTYTMTEKICWSQCDMILPEIIRVLNVDDHPQVRCSLADFLDLWDDFHVVDEANNGDKTVAIMEKPQPAVNLIYLLPSMNGLAAIRLLEEKFLPVQVMTPTNNDVSKIINKVREAGATSYLLKSVNSAC